MSVKEIEQAIKDRFNPKKLYDVYDVTIRFREKVCGGKPMNEELLRSHIIRKTGHDDELTTKLVEQAMEGMPPDEGDLDKKVQNSRSRFHSDEHGVYIDTYQMKAMLRQSASMRRLYTKKVGTKQICAEGMEVKGLLHERRLHFGKMRPTGTYEAPLHIMTAAGKIDGIKQVDFLEEEGIELSFQVWILHTDAKEKRHVGEEDLVDILTFSQENGVGSNRSQGYGKFDIANFKRVQ